MATSTASTVAGYLAELPPDRRAVVAEVRDRVKRVLQPGFEEGMSFGMIGWTVPLSHYPMTYNKQPLAYVSLAAQKKGYSLYLMAAYAESPEAQTIAEAYEAAGRRLDMGKSCLRFADPGAVLWEVVEATIARYSVDEWIAVYERSRGMRQ